MAKNTDLHTHSYYSDGQISPKELVRLAKKRGIKNLALTDHDSVQGVSEAMAEGKRIGVSIVPAVEVRASNSNEVLGYFVDIKNKELLRELKKSCQRVENRIRDWCKKLNKEGYSISFKELQTRFPRAKGHINSFYPLYLLYLKGYGKTMELGKRFSKNKRLKAKKIKERSIIQAIKLIKKANGVPVLAHPWLENPERLFKDMDKLVKAGLKGIELNNGDRPPFKPKDMEKKIRKVAKKYSLILTSGSDYHGEELVKLMPGNHSLGKNNCDEKVVEELRELVKKNNYTTYK